MDVLVLDVCYCALPFIVVLFFLLCISHPHASPWFRICSYETASIATSNIYPCHLPLFYLSFDVKGRYPKIELSMQLELFEWKF